MLQTNYRLIAMDLDGTLKNDEKKIIVHYISDLHLNHKIFEKANAGKTIGETTLEEIELSVSQIVKSIKHRNNYDYEKVILLGGDVTEDFVDQIMRNYGITATATVPTDNAGIDTAQVSEDIAQMNSSTVTAVPAPFL